jgi:acyl-CoA thioester hydrolase
LSPKDSPEIDLKDPASYDWWTDVSIRFSDQDPNLHVNNTAFAQYAEAGRVDYLVAMQRHLGIEPRSALASVQISYINQLHYPGTVRVGTRLLRLGNKSYALGQGLFAGDTVVATSEAVLVFFDYASNSSARCRPICAVPTRPARRWFPGEGPGGGIYLCAVQCD